MAGWGSFFGKIAEQFQGRIERLKNEKIKLSREYNDIMDGKCTTDKAKRMTQIDKRLAEIDAILINKASD